MVKEQFGVVFLTPEGTGDSFTKSMTVAALALLTLIWLVPFLLLWKIPYPERESIPEDRTARRSISVIIPARNEELTLPALLESLKQQGNGFREVLVVNDHSEDATAEIATRYGARVIEAAPLPEGWLGKPWVCWQGARQAGGEIFLFLDADTRIEEGGLQKILYSYLPHGVLLSIWPYHRMQRLYERLSALFNIIIMASMGSFTIRGTKRRNLGAFGPCVVCSKSDYFKVGGHAAVKAAILEDVALGQLFDRAGLDLHNYGGKETISFRMYPAGIESLITGFSKGMASGAQVATPGILIPIILWVAGGFVISVWLLVLLLGSHLQAAAPWTVLHALYILQIYWILHRMGNYGLYTAVLYPLPFVFFAGVFVISLARTFLLHEVSWKGRKIDLER
jgi:4,4'-diaponeurosporenoate glycosyltransferase